MKKVFITGARGQLGLDLQKRLDKEQINYSATDLPECNITDLCKLESLISQEKPDIIINCAAYNAVDQAEKDWRNAYLVNGIGPKNLAIISNQLDIPLVHFSTDYVFDGTKDKLYTIVDKPNPINQYGKSKLLGEYFVQSLTKKYYLVRLSWVFGIGNINFAKKVIEWSKQKKELKIVNDQISCPCYTSDIVKALIDLIKTNSYGIYHLTNTGYCSRFEWANYILRSIQCSTKVIPASSNEFITSAKRPSFTAMDSFPIQEIVGYKLPEWKDATERFLKELGY